MSSPTGTAASRLVGIGALVSTALVVWLGGWVSPPDVNQGQLVRLIYLHPAVATYCYVGFGLCALGSILYLWPRTRSRRWDQLAGASAEVGVVFCVATLVTGSIWGRASWGVWWTWDARLTLTALLLAVFLGYLALRRSGGEAEGRAKRCAVAALLCFIVVPIDHEATNWWSTLHQGDTLVRVGQSPLIHGWQLAVMLLSFVSFGLIFAWMVMHRLALEVLEDRFEDEGVVSAIAERRAEGAHGGYSAEGAHGGYSAEGAHGGYSAEGAHGGYSAEGRARPELATGDGAPLGGALSRSTAGLQRPDGERGNR